MPGGVRPCRREARFLMRDGHSKYREVLVIG